MLYGETRCHGATSANLLKDFMFFNEYPTVEVP